MGKKLNLALLMGGPSAEHEVSLASGKEVMRHLDLKKYQVTPVVISKTGKWKIGDSIKLYTPTDALKQLQTLGIHVAFIALHGKFGEDGILQALLEEVGIRYTGSGVLASALAMNKPLANKLFRSAGLLVPQGEVIEFANRNKPRRVKLPAVVKPVDGGSSVGVSIVWNNNELVPAIKRAFKYSENILIEEYITGREVTCGVLYEQGEAIALPPTEIIPKSGFFDYDAKYIPGKTEEITPARFPKRVLHAIQETALSAHNALQCGGMSRTDMIVQILNIKNQKSKIRNPARLRMYDLPAMTSSLRSQAGVQAGGQIPKIYVLEINTIPGMTKTSLLPQAAEAAGISFSKMLDMIVLSAIKTKVN